MSDLNKKFSYTLKQRTYRPSNLAEARLIYHKNIRKSFWGKQGAYKRYRDKLKIHHYYGQRMRCAYCRTKLRTDGYFEDLDHIIPQDLKGNWIFYPKNLVVTCNPCNRLKNKDATLVNVYKRYFPLRSEDFTIFNPHFDNWKDHFVIEKEIFLKGIPGTKGPETYRICKLYRHDVIINFVEERKWSFFTMTRLTQRLKKVSKGSYEEDSIKKAINHLIERKKHKI